jgi:hypothetical protein
MTPLARDPNRVLVRGCNPVAVHPDVVVAVPLVVSVNPNPASVRARAVMFDDDVWRVDLDIDTLREG